MGEHRSDKGTQECFMCHEPAISVDPPCCKAHHFELHRKPQESIRESDVDRLRAENSALEARLNARRGHLCPKCGAQTWNILTDGNEEAKHWHCKVEAERLRKQVAELETALSGKTCHDKDAEVAGLRTKNEDLEARLKEAEEAIQATRALPEHAGEMVMLDAYASRWLAGKGGGDGA